MNGAASQRRRSLGAGLALALALAGLLLLPRFAIGSGTEFSSDILIYAIMAVGLYVQLALLGLVNFGFSAFFGLGGYVGAAFLARQSSGLFESAAFTVGCVALAAAAFGALALKTRETAFTMVTLAFSQLLYVLAVADDRWTGGVNGLTGVPRPKLPSILQDGLGLSLESDVGFYYLCVAAFVGVLALVSALQQSRLGSVFAGIRENEERMAVLGYPVYRFKLAGFVLSGAIGGFAGYLNAILFGYVGPGSLFWTTSGEALLMVILGGTSSLAGPVLGAATFVGISHYATAFTDHWRLIVGIVFIAIVLFAPQGLVKIVRDRLRGPRRGSRQPTASRLSPESRRAVE